MCFSAALLKLLESLLLSGFLKALDVLKSDFTLSPSMRENDVLLNLSPKNSLKHSDAESRSLMAVYSSRNQSGLRETEVFLGLT